MLPAECGLSDWVDYRVRTSGVWTVVGTRSGFLHQIVEDEEGRCVARDDADPRLGGRARQCDPDDEDPTCVFENPYLRFRMAPGLGENGRPVPTVVDTVWTFDTTGALDPLSISAGGMPTMIEYVPGLDALTVVDPVGGGLVEVDVSSLAPQRSFQ